MESGERSVIHFNVADFAVAVERLTDPNLHHRPLIIGHMGANRAIVHDMSEEAYQSGVRKGMKLRQATRICKDAALLPPRFPLYQRAMIAFIKKVHGYTPLIEHGTSDGHIFLDVTGTHRLFGPAVDIGWRIQKEVRRTLCFTPIWAVATNKLVAKVASRVVKPIGEYIVAAGEEKNFLAPLPISLLPGIHNHERSILQQFNLNSIGQLATLSQKQLLVPFGKRSVFLHEIARGIDPAPLVTRSSENKAVLQTFSFPEDTNDRKEVEGLVAFLAAKCGQTLRQQERTARRMSVTITYSDGGQCVRQATRKQPSNDDFILTDLALLALQRCWTRRTRIRDCQLSCDLFRPASKQMSLFTLETTACRRQKKLTEAMDSIRRKYGDTALLTGRQHHHAQGKNSETSTAFPDP